MSTHTVARAFSTRTRRFAVGQDIGITDLADDALPLAERVGRGDLTVIIAQPAEEPAPPPVDDPPPRMKRA